MDALAAEAHELIARVAIALARRQHRDGFWREFALKPGQSETWSTAWTGWGLAHAATAVPALAAVRGALHGATAALAASARPAGWGYNRLTGCDADSTAWAVLLLAVTAPPLALAAVPALLGYVDAAGNAHTFAEPQYGDWSGAHGEVTALAALALAAAGCPPGRVAPLRAALVARASAPFWWDTASYANAWRLAALAGTGGIPPEVAAQAAPWLRDGAGRDATPFEHALHLLALGHLQQQASAHGELAAWHAHRLLAAATPQGWPGSCVLLVPPQGRGGTTGTLPRGPHHDSGTMTSALALAALARWLRTRVPAPLRRPGWEILQGGSSWNASTATASGWGSTSPRASPPPSPWAPA